MVIAHSPEADRNVLAIPSTRTLNESESEDDVVTRFVNESPAIVREPPLPLQRSAIVPGGGDHTAGVVSWSSADDCTTWPVTASVPDPCVTDPATPGEEVDPGVGEPLTVGVAEAEEEGPTVVMGSTATSWREVATRQITKAASTTTTIVPMISLRFIPPPVGG
jgi:hypothetical protein